MFGACVAMSSNCIRIKPEQESNAITKTEAKYGVQHRAFAIEGVAVVGSVLQGLTSAGLVC